MYLSKIVKIFLGRNNCEIKEIKLRISDKRGIAITRKGKNENIHFEGLSAVISK